MPVNIQQYYDKLLQLIHDGVTYDYKIMMIRLCLRTHQKEEFPTSVNMCMGQHNMESAGQYVERMSTALVGLHWDIL